MHPGIPAALAMMAIYAAVAGAVTGVQIARTDRPVVTRERRAPDDIRVDRITRPGPRHLSVLPLALTFVLSGMVVFTVAVTTRFQELILFAAYLLPQVSAIVYCLAEGVLARRRSRRRTRQATGTVTHVWKQPAPSQDGLASPHRTNRAFAVHFPTEGGQEVHAPAWAEKRQARLSPWQEVEVDYDPDLPAEFAVRGTVFRGGVSPAMILYVLVYLWVGFLLSLQAMGY